MSDDGIGDFPAIVTFIRQADMAHTHKQEIMSPDDDVPAIPPDHAVVIQYSGDDLAYLKAADEVRTFALPKLKGNSREWVLPNRRASDS